MKIPFKIYRVEWIDSQTEEAWMLRNKEEEIDPIYATTIGFKVAESSKCVKLALNFAVNKSGESEQYSCCITIPKCSILKMKRIK